MTAQLNPEAAVKEAVEQAERACAAAVEETPVAYRGFLMFIRQNKRVAGTRSKPAFASIRLPYMGVDGRVKMAQDEHREQGASLVIQTQFETEPAADQLTCRAVVTSSLKGTTTAHARVFLNGGGVDATNPLENAETSAVGRALGFLGYGLYGTGIASAEEVLLAVAEREAKSQMLSSEAVAPSAEAAAAEQAAAVKPPTDRQRVFLRNLLEQTGTPEEEVEERLSQIETSQDASQLISELRAQLSESAA